MDQIQAVLIIPFSLFQIPSHAGALYYHSTSRYLLFRSAQDISEIRVSTLLSFQLLRGCYLIQAIYFNRRNLSFKLFNGVSFEWALAHMSFPRILPDSSHSPGAILNSFFKV